MRLQRLKALFFDWLFISAYLATLFVVMMIVYYVGFNGVPDFTVLETQLLAAFTSVIPVILVFSKMESQNRFASWGKAKAGLQVIYTGDARTGSLIRNTLKFLPWQLGHMSTINGIHNGFESPASWVFSALAMILAAVYVVMAFTRKDNRHLADLLAGSRVVYRTALGESVE